MSFFWRGGTCIPVLDLWDSTPECVLPYSLSCGAECNIHFLISSSGATCANLLVAGSTASHFHRRISRDGARLGFEPA